MLKRLSHVMIWVSDMKRAVAWYKGALGFGEVFVTPHYSLLRHEEAGCHVALHPCSTDSPDLGHGASPWFSVGDIDAAVAELRGKGVAIEDPKQEGSSPRFAGFRDSEGNPLGLQEG